MFFRVRILGGLRDHIFFDFGTFFGSLLDAILGTFRVPFLHRFSEGFQDSPKVKERRGWVVIWSVAGALTYRQQTTR